MNLTIRACCLAAVILAVGPVVATVADDVDDLFGGGAAPGGPAVADDPFDEPADPFGAPPPKPAKPAEKKPEDEPEIELPPEPPVDPELLRLHLTDGSVFSGKLTVKEITVATKFGSLTVPITKLRRFMPGLESRAELNTQVAELIETLGDDDYRKRETAQLALIKMGLPVRGELQLHRDDENAERARRVKMILQKLETLAEDEGEDDSTELWTRDDTVETTSFTMTGKISPRTFTINGKYGVLTVPLGDIKSVRRVLRLSREDIRKSVSLDGTYIAQMKYKSSGVRVERGDKITVNATGRISRSGSSSYVSTPAGTSRFGTFMSSPMVYGGTLVARIGSGGSVIKVGASRTFTATRSGTLRFAIGMRPDYVGRYQFPGKYDLKIKVRPGD